MALEDRFAPMNVGAGAVGYLHAGDALQRAYYADRPVTHQPVTRLSTRLGIGEGKLRASQALDDSRRQPRALCRFQRWRRMLCEVAAEQDLRAIGAAQEEVVS